MTFTRELVLLAATALAWFAYALIVGNPDPVDPLISDVVRTAAMVLSGVLGVRAGGLVFVDGLMERVWGLPSNALIRLVVYMALTMLATGFVLKVGLDLNVTTLLTTSALLTAILGFAMQSTLAAFFSGVALAARTAHPPGRRHRRGRRACRGGDGRLAVDDGAALGRGAGDGAQHDRRHRCSSDPPRQASSPAPG